MVGADPQTLNVTYDTDTFTFHGFALTWAGVSFDVGTSWGGAGISQDLFNQLRAAEDPGVEIVYYRFIYSDPAYFSDPKYDYFEITGVPTANPNTVNFGSSDVTGLSGHATRVIYRGAEMGHFDVSEGTPEPGTWCLFGIGLAALMFRRPRIRASLQI